MATMQKPRDWQCPNPSCVNHVKMVFGSKDTCPQCGEPKPQATLNNTPSIQAYNQAQPRSKGGDNPNDWQCPNTECHNHTNMVFGKHESCPKCGTAKNAKQAGDWLCANPQCINSKNCVFASKHSCPKCGMPKPAYGKRGGGFGGGMGGGFGASLLTQLMGGGMMPSANAKPGDWLCPNTTCINNQKYVFARHAACPKCGCQKPASAQIAGTDNPGDWQCPNVGCRNHTNRVFAKHASCPSCGHQKPAGLPAAPARTAPAYGMGQMGGMNPQLAQLAQLAPQLAQLAQLAAGGGMRFNPY
eukprot:gb/GFBE01069031.1/.p2 GENE.gb/GFBE01069031.1/~~gb/GFBE01069031.1/.p2  ORF type:complete len:300 (-),score=56.90 gb/GFBE01069031.1/:82-981(-)